MSQDLNVHELRRSALADSAERQTGSRVNSPVRVDRAGFLNTRPCFAVVAEPCWLCCGMLSRANSPSWRRDLWSTSRGLKWPPC